jgi:cysteine synthase A
MKATVLDAIGTPLVRVRSPEGATVAAKLEGFNPGGSAKDRPALAMVEAAERSGALEPGERIVEATSGNTGIGLAVVCAARGYDLTLVMPERMSEERRRLLRAYGAEIDLVAGEMTAARQRADELAADGAVRLRQFENEANPGAHYRTTAEELLDAVGDREIDAFVAGVGTGGTITGTATRLLEAFPDMTVVAVEPERNAVLSTGESGDSEERCSSGNRTKSGDNEERCSSGNRTESGADDYQGMGPGFVSDLLDRELLDEVETVAVEDAEAEARRLAREEGILVGQSSGAASVAATRVAERLAEPALDCPPAPAAVEGTAVTADGGVEDGHDDCPLVVTVFPDSGERYLSTGMF